MNQWSDDEKAKLMAEHNRDTKEFDDEIKIVLASAPSVASDMPGALSLMNTSKSNAEAVVERISRRKNKVKSIIDAMNQATSAARADIDRNKDEIGDLSEVLEKESSLDMIRKEQAESLAKKYNSTNLHFSWMGLLRPLKPESRTAIIIISICLLVISVLCGWFAFSIGILRFQLPDLNSPFLTKISNLLMLKRMAATIGLGVFFI
jgi:hypothetical protein